MRSVPSAALVAGVGLLVLAGAARAQPPVRAQPPDQPPGQVQPPVRVYGLEIDTRRRRERLLVFGDRPLRHRLEEQGPGRLLLVLPGAVLDPSAPTVVRPARPGAIVAVRAREVRGAEAPEVHLDVTRAAGAVPRVEERGSMLALGFAAPAAPTKRISLPFEDADLPEVVEKIARAVGETFLYDEKLRGRVTIALAEPVTLQEARALLDSVLLLEGFAAVPTPGGAWRVLPIQEGRAVAPWRKDAPSGDGEALVATLVRPSEADAAFLATTLGPWLGQAALAVAQPETNALILVASEQRVRQLLSVVSILDAGAGEQLLLRRLRHRGAEEVGEILEAALADEPVPGRRAQIWTDARTNTLLLRAAPARLDELREWIQRIDRAPEAEGVLQVRRLRHADPEALAELFGELARGTAPAAGRDGVPGRAAQALAGRPYTVVADRPTSSLVIQADPETYGVIDDLLGILDQPPQRVYVEALVLEVATDSSLDLGFDAFIPLTRPRSPSDPIGSALLDPTGSGLFQPGSGSGPSFGARYTRKPLLIPIVDESGMPIDVLPVPRETVVLTADAREIRARVLSRPHIAAVSGEENEISLGDNIPVLQSTVAEGASDVLQNRINVQRQDVGVRLRITPTLGEGDRVKLELDIETSRIGDSLVGDVNRVGPTIEQRHVTTTFWLYDGEIAVVATGRFPEYNEVEVGTPWLKDIPFLGQFFRSLQTRKLEARLLVTAQVRVQPDPAEVLAETIRRRLALERVLAREGGLEPADGPYALRIATRREGDDARAIAASFEQQGRRTRVLRWEWDGRVHWDVYLVGFETPSDASDAALGARGEGWTAEFVVVPESRSS